jgi:hypothetical protein
LVVVFSEVETADLESAIRRRADPDAEVRLVAPPELSRLRWLFMDVDRAHERAHSRVADAARAVDADLSVHAEALEPAHPNPRQAVEDALRTFPADEVIVVTHPQTEASWQEQHAFGDLDELDVPVRVLPLAGLHG